MKNNLLFFIIVFVITGTQGQSQEIKNLKGRIISQNEDITGVVVRNANTERAVITDAVGHFTIPVRENDTLVFLAVQFKNKVLPVTTALFNSAFVTVPLEAFVNELDEVEVRPFNLTGKLDADVQNLTLKKDVSAEALGLPNAHRRHPTQSERLLSEASAVKLKGSGGFGLAGGGVSLNPIINAITGRTKMLKNRVAVDKKYAQTQVVKASFEYQFFTEVLKIPEEKIDDFMYFCEVDDSFQTAVATEDQLKIWEFMRTKSVAYRENNGLD